MSTFSKSLVLGLCLLANACDATSAATSGRFEGGHGPAGAFNRGVEARTPPNVEARTFDHQVDRDMGGRRENPTFRIESDCRRCR